MNLREFGKLIKKKYGSVGGELLQKMHEFYVEDKEQFEKAFDPIEEIGTKGCYLHDNISNKKESFIIFGYKYFDKRENKISIKGDVIARGEECPFIVGQVINPSSTIVNQFKMLDSAGLITSISDYNMITTEKEDSENE